MNLPIQLCYSKPGDDFMFKTELEYSRETLFVHIEGVIHYEEMKRLKHKMYRIINEYGINDIVIDIKKATNIDTDAFYEFIEDYQDQYSGSMKVIS